MSYGEGPKRYRSRRPLQRSGQPATTRTLIGNVLADHPGWDAADVHAELCSLGYDIPYATVKAVIAGWEGT